MHRQDDSGTTDNFTKYLEAAGEGAWTFEPDDTWPSDITVGEAAEGTSGVVGAVGDGDGTIGYADASAAGDLGVVNIKVGEEYVAPSAEGAAKVVAISPATEGNADVDMAFDLARDTTEAGTYPLVLVSYLLACQTYADADEADLVKAFLTYVLSAGGPAGRRRRGRLRTARLGGRRPGDQHRRDDLGELTITSSPIRAAARTGPPHGCD